MTTPVPTSGSHFPELVAQHVAQYRPPVGSLTHPNTKTIPDPRATHEVQAEQGERARLTAVDKRRRATMIVAAPVTLLSSAFTLSVGTSVSTDFGMGLSAALTVLVVCVTGAMGVRSEKAIATFDATRPDRALTVPVDVAAAWSHLSMTPAQLRKTGASEDVVGKVEALLSHAQDLLIESARLTARDAGSTEDAIAVRDRLVEYAARAQSVVVLAQRHQQAIEDADLTTALVLGSGPAETLDEAAATMEAETAWVAQYLEIGFERPALALPEARTVSTAPSPE